MKKIILLAAIVFLLSGCSEQNSEQVVYSAGITTFSSSNLSDLTVIRNYISSIGLPLNGVTYTGHGKSESQAISDADAQAKRDTDKWIAKLNDDDILSLGLHINTYFVWGVTRLKDSSDPYSESILIGEFKWNTPIE